MFSADGLHLIISPIFDLFLIVQDSHYKIPLSLAEIWKHSKQENQFRQVAAFFNGYAWPKPGIKDPQVQTPPHGQ
jgi:hypothetical protein